MLGFNVDKCADWLMAAPFFAASVQRLTLMEEADIRILVAMEDDYRAYREMISAALRILRPGTEVQSTTLEALEEELERVDPQVVICEGHEDVEPDDGAAAWIELSLDPTQPTKISVGGRFSELTNPRVEELLSVIDKLGVTHLNKPEGTSSPK